MQSNKTCQFCMQQFHAEAWFKDKYCPSCIAVANAVAEEWRQRKERAEARADKEFERAEKAEAERDAIRADAAALRAVCQSAASANLGWLERLKKALSTPNPGAALIEERDRLRARVGELEAKRCTSSYCKDGVPEWCRHCYSTALLSISEGESEIERLREQLTKVDADRIAWKKDANTQVNRAEAAEQRVRELEAELAAERKLREEAVGLLQTLIEMYIRNQGTEHEFVTTRSENGVPEVWKQAMALVAKIDAPATEPTAPTARELLSAPPEVRAAVLSASAEQAVREGLYAETAASSRHRHHLLSGDVVTCEASADGAARRSDLQLVYHGFEMAMERLTAIEQWRTKIDVHIKILYGNSADDAKRYEDMGKRVAALEAKEGP